MKRLLLAMAHRRSTRRCAIAGIAVLILMTAAYAAAFSWSICRILAGAKLSSRELVIALTNPAVWSLAHSTAGEFFWTEREQRFHCADVFVELVGIEEKSGVQHFQLRIANGEKRLQIIPNFRVRSFGQIASEQSWNLNPTVYLYSVEPQVASIGVLAPRREAVVEIPLPFHLPINKSCDVLVDAPRSSNAYYVRRESYSVYSVKPFNGGIK